MPGHTKGSPGPGKAIAKGALVLGAAAVVSKLLGTLQKIPLQNVAGDNVFGIYNAVYPLYILIMFVATAGFPIAVSRFVAEERANGRPDGALGVLRMALALSVGTGLVCFGLLYFGAGTIASWIGNRQTEAALRSVSFALLFVPVMASLRGYFQGLGDMIPTGVSQVAEQFARVAVMVALLVALVRAGASDASIAAGATFGSAAGAFAGLLVMAGYWAAHRRRSGGRPSAAADAGASRRANRGVGYRAFIGYALPICLGSIVLPMLTLADTFTMPRLLVRSGLDEAGAMTQFGLYNHGLPLVQLVAMVASSMSVALVPALSHARATGTLASVRRSAEASLRIAWLIGLAASAGMAVAAIPLNVMFFASPAGYEAMTILAFTAVFSVVQIVTSALLQGLGAERATAVHLLVAAAVKVGLNLLLMPLWGIEGAAVAAVAAYAAAAGLNVVRLRRYGFARLGWREYGVKPAVCTLAMAAVAAAVLFAADRLAIVVAPDMPYRLRQTIAALLAVAAGALAFALLLFRAGLVRAEELAAVPKLGAKLLPPLRKWRILPHQGGTTCPQPLPSSDSAPETKTN
ncbi:putative polysaccharide biosynthesis protein [Paenibacillus flagellatus]|uniref:Polysaccharide biosynthesis protein n=1 Tax=Paenibacillus flagellatus TaxID=2211139 RepID=A0A2V5JUA3_9BACL|nr:polysaccharide biosynthesis protein [Paenibacillus flagellatus]PYI50225.1 polysaccharide biosynthesis protein [Paenibacillus flagellatus]